MLARIRPLSLLLGFALASVVLVAMGNISATPVNIARVEYYARPQDMIQIREGVPFVVPSEKVLILTSLGVRDGGSVELWVNGAYELYVGGGGMPGFATIKPFGAGTTLEVFCTNIPGDGRAWGYLDRASPAASNVLRVRYAPEPSQYVEVQQGAPFTVPTGKIFVLTSQGQARGDSGNYNSQFLVNGLVENSVYGSLHDVPVGMTVPSGNVVEAVGVFPPSTNGRAWGYLADD